MAEMSSSEVVARLQAPQTGAASTPISQVAISLPDCRSVSFLSTN